MPIIANGLDGKIDQLDRVLVQVTNMAIYNRKSSSSQHLRYEDSLLNALIGMPAPDVILRVRHTSASRISSCAYQQHIFDNLEVIPSFILRQWHNKFGRFHLTFHAAD